MTHAVIWAFWRENLILMHANNKGADQPVHPHSLISTFVILPLVACDIVSKLASCEIPILLLVSVAEQAGLKHHLVANSKNSFYRDKAHIINGAVNGIFQQDQTSLWASI